MNGVDKFKTMLDAAFAMAKFVNDHYDDLKAVGVDIEEAASMLKKLMNYCQQQMRVNKSGK